jgi:thiol-disulfide isomerase/thioredoxin
MHTRSIPFPGPFVLLALALGCQSPSTGDKDAPPAAAKAATEQAAPPAAEKAATEQAAPPAADTAAETTRTSSRSSALKHADALKKVAAAQKLEQLKGGTAAERAPKTVPAHVGKPGDIKWGGTIDWKSWSDGLAAAKASKKPICLVVYTDWCPRCKELAPVFEEPEMAALAKEFVMIRQDADEKPQWLVEQFNQPYGGYVPRIFFLDAEGTVRPEITSGNDRYPYFYTPRGKAALLRSMKQAKG